MLRLAYASKGFEVHYKTLNILGDGEIKSKCPKYLANTLIVVDCKLQSKLWLKNLAMMSKRLPSLLMEPTCHTKVTSAHRVIVLHRIGEFFSDH